MKAFLDYVAQDIIDKYGNDLSHVAIVFLTNVHHYF